MSDHTPPELREMPDPSYTKLYELSKASPTDLSPHDLY